MSKSPLHLKSGLQVHPVKRGKGCKLQVARKAPSENRTTHGLLASGEPLRSAGALHTLRLRVGSNLQPATFNLQPASGFTLIEILIAIGLLAMIITAIFASWTSILRATKTGLDAAASVQRSRIVLRTLEDSLGSAQSFAVNLPYYAFVAQNGSDASLSFVARLAKSFPRSGKFGDLDVRRLTFSVEDGPDNSRQLVLRQCPLMMELDKDIDEMQHPLVLAKNVKGFDMLFWDKEKNDWVDEWSEMKTNQLPRLVMFTLRLAPDAHAFKATEEITRVVALPSMTVPPMWQMPRGMPGPGGPGGQQPGGGAPGNQPPPNQMTQPGGQPGGFSTQPRGPGTFAPQ